MAMLAKVKICNSFLPIILVAGIARVSTWLNMVTRAEKIIRIIVSIIFVWVGIYLVVLWIQA